MATSNSPLAFTDCYETMDRAIASAKGIRLRFLTHGEARHYRTRLHAARQLNRLGNAETYKPDHPMHGNSEYDALVVKLRAVHTGQHDGPYYLLIEKVSRSMEIEEISDSP